METVFVIGLAVAFGGALLLASGQELQSRAVYQAHGRWAVFLRAPRWYAGLSLLGIAIATNFVALALAPVSVVQSVSIIALAASAIYGALTGRVSITRNGVVSIALCMIGILGFITIMAAHPGDTTDDAALASQLTTVVTILAVLTGFAWGAVLLRRVVHAYWTRLLGLFISAIVFGSITTVFKTLVNHTLTRGPGNTFTDPAVLTGIGVVIVGGIAANVLLQTSHRFFPTPVVVAAITIIDPLTAAVVGITVLAEAILTPVAVLGLVGFGAVACTGVMGVSRIRRITPLPQLKGTPSPSTSHS